MSAAGYTLRSWVLSADSRRAAILFLATLPLPALAALFPAVLLQLELLTPSGDLMEVESFHLLEAWHGTVMVLLVLLPLIPAGLGYALLEARPLPPLTFAGWLLWVLAGIWCFARLVSGRAELGGPAQLAAWAVVLLFLALFAAIRKAAVPPSPLAWSLQITGVAWLLKAVTSSIEPAAAAPLALVPALGAVAEVFRASSGGRLYGQKLVAWLLGATAAATFLPWGSGLLQLDRTGGFWVLLPLAVLPPATLLACLFATVLERPPAPRRPALAFARVSIGLLILTGGAFLFLTSPPTNRHVAGTAFEAALLHYVAGTVLAAFLAGLHHWRDLRQGCAATAAPGDASARLLFAAWNLTFLPGFVSGYLGLPAAMYDYPPSFQALQVVSSVGALLVVAALAAAVRDLVQRPGGALRSGSHPAGGELRQT